MNRLLGFSVLLLLPLAGQAVAESVFLGPTEVELDRDAPPTCALPLEVPCFVGVDPGATGGVGDDRILLHQLIRSVGVRVDAGVPLAVVIDLQHGSVPITAFQQYSALDQEVDARTPAEVAAWFDLDLDEDGQHVLAPDFDDDAGAVYTWRRDWGWSDDFVNYTAVHLPYTTYARSTEDSLRRVAPWQTGCPVTFILGPAGCQAREIHTLLNGAADLTPDIVLGAEVQSAAVGTAGETTSLGRGGSEQGFRFQRSFEPGHQASLLPDIAVARPSDGDASIGPPRGSSQTHPRKEADSNVQATSVHPATGGQVVPLWLGVAAGSLAIVIASLFHRIVGSRVIEHPQRKVIRAFVANHPGCNVAAIAAHTGLDYKTTQHHLGLLRRAGLIHIGKLGRRRTVVRAAGTESDALQAALVRHVTRQRILAEVASTPGVKQSDLARQFSVAKSTLHAHVALLVRAGMLVNRQGKLWPSARPRAAQPHE